MRKFAKANLIFKDALAISVMLITFKWFSLTGI